MPVPEQREPWTLPGSIFKPRVKECDATAFYDGAAVSPRLMPPAQTAGRLASLLRRWPDSCVPS